jgi:hypothetical protein
MAHYLTATWARRVVGQQPRPGLEAVSGTYYGWIAVAFVVEFVNEVWTC